MSDQLVAASVIKGYAQWLLVNNLGWNKADYGGLDPIIPFNDEPKLIQYDEPYIIYGYTESVDTRIYMLNNGTLTFVIRSKFLSDINRVSKVLIEAFRRWDESARDVNSYMKSTSTAEFDNILFQSTNIAYVEPGSEEKTEQGRVSGMLTINYTYSDESNFILR